MKLENLDTYIKNYLIYLQNTSKLKGINDVSYSIEKSNKSKSMYLKFVYKIHNKCYKKTIRVSDHAYHNHGSRQSSLTCIVLDTKKKYSKKDLKIIKASVRKTVTNLIYNGGQHAIRNFKAGDH